LQQVTMADQASKPSDPVDDGDVVGRTANASTPGLTTPVEAHPAALLGELARAMHQTATSQYERLTAELERLRVERINAIETRADAEAKGVQAEADSDIDAIHAWAQAESDRIGLEKDRRVEARRERLASLLERQQTIRDRQLFAVQVAADGHRNEIDEFFGRLERERNPTAIAQVASTLPPLPAFDEIAEDARTGAEAELAALHGPVEPPPDESMPVTLTVVPDPPAPDQPAPDFEPIAAISQSRLMAVMDPAASRRDGAEPARPWEAAPYAVGIASGSGETPRAEDRAPVAEANVPAPQPVGARSGPSSAQVYPADWPQVEPRPYAIVPRPRAGGRLLQAIPAKRPAMGRDGHFGEPRAGR
jgi:hypothetical protein